jgi:CDP-diacylglycerol--glycerol-3-phosphate 3-phosphatidyltransferase
LNLPNKLTLARIFLVPIIIVFLIAGEKVPNYTACAIFLAAVFTDWLDGRIARSTRQVTTLGKLLDPIADKLLISTALIALVQVGRAPAWMVVLIVGRELAITGLRTIAASQSIIIDASRFGKYKMLAEVAAVTLLILDWSPRLGIVALPSVGLLCLWGAMGLSIVSGIDYFFKFWKVIDLNR